VKGPSCPKSSATQSGSLFLRLGKPGVEERNLAMAALSVTWRFMMKLSSVLSLDIMPAASRGAGRFWSFCLSSLTLASMIPAAPVNPAILSFR